jgi:hypothetical protein
VASDAHAALKDGLKAVDNVLSFAKTGAGKPSAKERSLFVASVALSYAVWENFVEDLAIEAAGFPLDADRGWRCARERKDVHLARRNAVGSRRASRMACVMGRPDPRAG